MLFLVLSVCSIIVSGIIAVQDFKDRMVYFFLFPLLFVILLVRNFTQLSYWFSFFYLVSNIVVLSLIVITSFVYIKLRYGAQSRFFDKMIGMGDIYFLIAVAPLFSMFNYVLFLISGFLLSLTVHFLYVLITHCVSVIPLAGYLSMYIIVLMLVESCLSTVSLLSDFNILQFIICL